MFAIWALLLENCYIIKIAKPNICAHQFTISVMRLLLLSLHVILLLWLNLSPSSSLIPLILSYHLPLPLCFLLWLWYADDADISCSSYWILGHGFPEDKNVRGREGGDKGGGGGREGDAKACRRKRNKKEKRERLTSSPSGVVWKLQ